MERVFNFNTHPLTSRLKNVEAAGPDKWRASCPCGQNHSHDDKNQSLSIEYDRSTGNLIVYCHTGCTVAEICASAGCSVSDLFINKQLSGFLNFIAAKNGLTLVEVYSYCYGSFTDGLCKARFLDANGEKTFKWIKEDPNNTSGFALSHKDCEHRLYVAGSISSNSVFLVEGEKDANTVHRLLNATAVSAEDGATKAKDPGKKWRSEYTEQLTGKTVYILWDNDEAGRRFAQIEAQQIAGSAAAVFMLDLPQAWPDCPEKADISDYVKEVGPEEASQTLAELIATAEEYIAPEEDSQESTETVSGIIVHQANPAAAAPAEKPAWLTFKKWQNRWIMRIDEPMFAEMFQAEYKVTRINGVFYVNGKEVQDDYILMLIQRKIAVYFKENTGRLTRDVFTTMCNAVYSDQPGPDESKIYCRNGITINVKEDGSFEAVEEDLFTLTRIGANYDPSAACPTFTQYLQDLFYEEDIPAVQEYFGYCLIPCTRAQAGMFIKGKGGEGKSVLRDVTMALFGHAAIQEYVHELGARFTIANLENKLVVIDDDLQTDLLKETSTLKKLITARERFQVERKLKTKYDAYLYARILAIGNTFIGSKFDHSDGFYRRQLLIDVKPKTREDKDDDRFMSDKCIKEIPGILNWALDGLSRLIKNNYHFTVSERMARTLDNIKHDGDNSLSFVEDDTYIEITKDPRDQTTTRDLFTLYAAWCTDNGDVPIKRKSFQLRMSERFKDYKTRIRSTEGKLQGFTGIRLTDHAELRLSRMTDKERERIVRLP